MRAGRMDRKASFYAKVKSTNTDFGGTTDTWPTLTFDTWGEIQYAGGDAILSNEEKFYSGTIFFKVRYRSTIVETMRVKIAEVWYRITYIEELGRKEGLRLSLTKIND
jgi:SPP1 family predicted phage head-tail adaptor